MAITSQQRNRLKILFPDIAGLIDRGDNSAVLNKILENQILQNYVDKMELQRGFDGIDGYTPIKGKDYLTDKEKQDFINEIRSYAPKDGRDGKDGIDGKSVDIEALIKKIVRFIPDPIQGEPGRDGSEIKPQELADKLNTLKGSIDISVIKGGKDLLKPLTERIDKLQKSTTLNPKGLIDQRYHGGGLSRVSTDSTLTGLGTPASPLSVVSTGGGFTRIAFLGSVNSSNVTFTVSQVPTWIIADGVWFEALDSNGNVQWSNVGLTITMVNPPSASIYGFK